MSRLSLGGLLLILLLSATPTSLWAASAALSAVEASVGITPIVAANGVVGVSPQKPVLGPRPESVSSPALSPPKSMPEGPLVIVTPTFGRFKNVLRFTYHIPTGPNELTARTKELTDSAHGAALVSSVIMGRWALGNVTFLVPEVNQSQVIGSTFFAAYYHNLTSLFDFYGGLGVALMNIDGHYEDFQDSVTKGGVTATAHLDDVWVDNAVIAPSLRTGLRLNIPIQHWYVALWGGYMFESFRLRIRSSGGRVYVPPPIDDTKIIPQLNVKKWTHYRSPLVGLDLRLDFHYAMQFRARLQYDLDHENLVVRLMAYTFFSREVPVGIAGQFAYVEGIVHDNIYGFLGPTFLF